VLFSYKRTEAIVGLRRQEIFWVWSGSTPVVIKLMKFRFPRTAWPAE